MIFGLFPDGANRVPNRITLVRPTASLTDCFESGLLRPNST